MMDNLTILKREWSSLSDQEKKSFSVFMVNKMLSMSEELIDLVNFSQLHSNIPPENIYKFWFNILPQKKLYLSFIKKTKSNKDADLIEILAEFFQISTTEMSESLHLLSRQDIEKILYGIGMDSKTIKKLLHL